LAIGLTIAKGLELIPSKQIFIQNAVEEMVVMRVSMRWRVPTAVASVALLAGGCGTGSMPAVSKTAPSARHSVAVGKQASSQPSPSTPADTGPHGIVVAVETALNTVQLEALDPATGAVTETRTFTGGPASLAFDPSDPGFVWRESFSKTFAAMASSGPQEADGSVSAGTVNDQGVYTPLTASTSGGYGTTLQKHAIGFNPATGDLWYQTPQGNGSPSGLFGYVSLATGKDQVPKQQPFQNGFVGGYNDRVYFAENGYGPVDIGAVTGTVFLPGGPEVSRDPVNNGFQIGRYGQNSDNIPDTRISPNTDVPWMLIPVDSRSFLATDTSHTQLFLCSLGQGVVHVHALLPASNRQVADVVVDPTGSLVAFVATDAGGQQQLYVSALSALNSVPRQLTQFAGIPGNSYGPDNYGLLAWQN
jgi:hypothetical protein